MLWVFDINETLLDLSPLDTVFAEEAGALKPAAAPYRFVLGAEGVSPDRAVMVAAHDWDLVVTRFEQVVELPGGSNR